MTWQVTGGQSFNAVAAQPIFGGGFSGKALAEANAADARILAANQRIVLGASSHLTQTGDSLQSIAADLGVTLDALLDGTDVLTSTTLLLPLAVVVAPDFGYTIAAGDTPASVAARFGVGLDGIADASAGVSGMFDSAADPNLNVPLLAQFQVGALIDEARRTLALQNLGAMMSRYYLHGLRLPTDGLTANARGLFVTGSPGNYQYPGQLGLFALTGQAFPLPDIADPDGGGSPPVFQYTLTRGASETWLSLGAPGSTALTFQLTDEGDYQRYARVAATAHAGPLATGTTSIAPSPVAAVQPTRFPLSTEMQWQTPAAVTLPRQPVPPTAPQPRLWSLPGAMINTPHDQGPLPRFEPVLARTDQASGTTVDQPVGDYGFGTLITFTVRKSVPAAGSPTSERLYEIIGAPDRDIVLLERLLDQLGTSNDSFQQMQVLYQPASTGSDVKGWQMDAPEATLAGISQVNLSTETAPPSQRVMAGAGATGQPPNIINTPLDFLRLLWEASITRQGGFYLGYSTGLGTGGAIQGLPDSTFNDRGEAQLAVLSLFVVDGGSGQQVASYMNVVATDEPLDTSDAAFVARAVLVDAQTDPLAGGATLATVAAAYYTGVDRLASANATAPLASNVAVTAAGGLYEVSPASTPPAGGLQAIADHFFTSVEAIKQANPHRASWPDPLPAYTGLALPTVTVTAGTSYPNGARFASLAEVAAYFGAPMAELAGANADVAGLFPAGATLSVQIGPADLTRAAPPAIPDDPADPDWGRIYLLNFFNLLGYRVADTPDFTASNWGLSGGPGDDEEPSSSDKVRAPLPPAAEGEPWRYTRTLPYPAFSKYQSSPDVLPASTVSPYWGVGGLLQIELVWVDLFGNKILTELDAPTAGSGAPLNFPPQLTGYTDRLLGLGQWPAVANAFAVAPDDGGQPALRLSLAFDQSGYTGATEEKIQQAIGIYAQILQQLHDPNGVAISLSTSVTPAAASVFTDAQVQALVGWAEGIYAWLSSLLPSTTTNLRAVASSFTPELDLSAPLDVSRLNDAQIFLVTASVTFTRQARFVNAELDAVAGVASVSTALAPATGPLIAGDQAQRDLGTFAADFTRAFAAVPGRSYRIAEGARRDAFTDTGTPNIWAVQLGTTTGEAISYRVQNPGDPIQYAPRPISNQLASKSKTPIIPYVTGTVIQPTDPAQDRAFTSIDLDQWMSSTLSRIDELLTPKYVAPAQILNDKLGTNSMQAVLDAKQALAEALESAMIAVFADESPTDEQLAAIQEVFYQRMLSALGEFYTVRAGIQFQAQVTAAIQPLPDDAAAPRLYGDVLLEDPAGIDPDPNASSISLTSPKLDLALAGEDSNPIHDVSFLLSSARLDAAKVTLALRYNGRAIEHEIGDLPGIEGYRPSSWLSFVDSTSGADWPLTQPLGTFDTPIVLRAFPETPALLVQEAAPELDSPCHVTPPAAPSPRRALAEDSCPKPGTYDPLENVTRWNYRFQYSLTAHDQRDAVHGQVTFNVADPGNAALQGAPARDLFDNLAEFVAVYPAVLADLDAYLVPIDVTTTDPVTLNNANAALLSAANMIQWIADTAAAGLAPPRARLAQPNAVPPFAFTLTQDGVPKTGPDGQVMTALRVTLKYAAPLPEGLGAPFVEIAPETYDCEPDGTSADGRSFVYKDRATGDYLTLDQGMAIPARALVLPDMNIIERQDAGTGIYLTRNEELVDGRRSAAPFIYQTPLVEFPAPLHPTLDSSTPVDLATIDAIDADHPVDRSLSCQLGVLYDTLFADAGTDTATLSLTAYYEYRMHPALSKVRLPVYLQPPTQVSLTEGGSGIPLSELIARQASGCEDWLAKHGPSTTEGTLLFDLVVMSDLTARPMPSLRLRALFVNLANVTSSGG
jgi:LysM repeat protein